MKKNKQLIVKKAKGDCFRACVTSILGMPNSKKLPNIDDKNWFGNWRKLLQPFGLEIVYEKEAIWRSGYWIASVKSKNFKGVSHAIVMFGDKVAHDPSTKKRYKVGEALLGKEIVNGGWYFEATDPTKVNLLTLYPQSSIKETG